MNNKNGQALGFKNDKGGYELRSPSFKGSSAPKSVTSIGNGAPDLIVFEGFFDFLSYCTIYKNHPSAAADFLILNSTAFFEKSRPLMDSHAQVRLFLDNDQTGQNCIQKALTWSPFYKNESVLYSGYKDLNEWTISIGKQRKQSIRQGP